MARYCPECAAEATDDVRFCKKCGTSLHGVVDIAQSSASFDWSKTWIAEMLLTEDERARRRAAGELTGRREDMVAAELKRINDRQNEIRNGIITFSAGIGVCIFFYIFFGAVAQSESNPKDVPIIEALWTIGLVPMLVGLGMLVNAVVVSRKFAEQRKMLLRSALDANTSPRLAAPPSAVDVSAPPSAVPSVTEHTTHHLEVPEGIVPPGRIRE